MNDAVKDGTLNVIDGKPVIFYDGYWIRYYAPPENSLAEKKLLIDQMTKRAFHHTEEGINTPGRKLDAARAAWESETDPARKRVIEYLAGARVPMPKTTANYLRRCESFGCDCP